GRPSSTTSGSCGRRRHGSSVGRSTHSTRSSCARLAEAAKTPVALLTGFLGSGKTTLLQRLLAHPGLGETAVIVNELGEVAIDHHLLRRVDERTVVLGNGCVCCTLRCDLADELRDLLGRRERGEIPPFGRVVVETTGLADPAPIVYTLLSEPVVKHHFALERVIATVDAVHGLREPESLRQAAAADRLVVTKADLADPAELVRRLGALNPAAAVLRASFGEVDPEALLGGPGGLEPPPRPPAGDHAHPEHGGVAAHSLVLGGPGPLLLNGVQHVVHPPVHLDAWPDGDRRSRLVFIGRGLDAGALRRSLAAFRRAARR